jgi:1-acyl-sn-glycerol-3-phosphate acyltransferase
MVDDREDSFDGARRLARSAAFGAYATGILGAVEVHRSLTPPAHRDVVVERYKRRLAKDALKLLGVRWRAEGALPAGRRARLVVSNHRAATDIGLMLAHFGGSLLSRHDLATWPVLGALARRGGAIFVDRNNARSGARAIREIRRRLGAGDTVTVFPEGATFAGDEVREFQGGAFAAARSMDVEVVPVGLAYTSGVEYVNQSFVEHLGNLASRPSTSVALRIGEPTRLSGKARTDAAHLREVVQDLVRQARNELP